MRYPPDVYGERGERGEWSPGTLRHRITGLSELRKVSGLPRVRRLRCGICCRVRMQKAVPSGNDKQFAIENGHL